jgi:hypothetical protein
MSAECGWIGEVPPVVPWRDSHYSRIADRIANVRLDQQRRDERAALSTSARLQNTK